MFCFLGLSSGHVFLILTIRTCSGKKGLVGAGGQREHGAQQSRRAAAVSAGPRAWAGARLPALPGPKGTCLSARRSPRPSSCSRVLMPKGCRKPGTHHPLNTGRLPSRSHRGKAHVLFCFANSAFIYRANLFSRFHSSKCVTTYWMQSPARALRQLALRSRAPALGPGVSAVPQTGMGVPSHMGKATQTCLLVPRADTHSHTGHGRVTGERHRPASSC